MNEDQELLDRFAIAAMQSFALPFIYGDGGKEDEARYADKCWSIAIAMKQARDRICTTAKPAEDQIPQFPLIDGDAIPERPSVIAAKRLGFEPFAYSERS